MGTLFCRATVPAPCHPGPGQQPAEAGAREVFGEQIVTGTAD